MEQKHIKLRKTDAKLLMAVLQQSYLLSNIAHNYKQDTRIPMAIRASLGMRQEEFDIVKDEASKLLIKIRKFNESFEK